MKCSKFVAGAMSIALLMGSISPSFGLEINKKIEVERIGGRDRVETSLMIAKKLNSKAVYITSGRDFPDALSISPLAAESEIGIILTMDNTYLNKELKNMGILTTSVIGGKNSVSDKIFNDLNKEFVANRLFGRDRYETSEIIAKGMKYFNVGVATGKTYPDALVAGPLLGKKGMAMLLVDGDKNVKLPENFKGMYTFGGKSSVMSDFGKRIAGVDRYETSEKVAEEFGKYDTVILASGMNFADALAVSPLSKKLNAPILLTDGINLSDNAKKIINSVKKVVIIGGEQSISKSLENSLMENKKEIKDNKITEKFYKDRKDNTNDKAKEQPNNKKDDKVKEQQPDENKKDDKNGKDKLEKDKPEKNKEDNKKDESNKDKKEPEENKGKDKPEEKDNNSGNNEAKIPVVEKLTVEPYTNPAQRGTTQVLKLNIEGKNLTDKDKEDLDWKIEKEEDGVTINDKGQLFIPRTSKVKEVTIEVTTKLKGKGVENKTAKVTIKIENPKPKLAKMAEAFMTIQIDSSDENSKLWYKELLDGKGKFILDDKENLYMNKKEQTQNPDKYYSLSQANQANYLIYVSGIESSKELKIEVPGWETIMFMVEKSNDTYILKEAK